MCTPAEPARTGQPVTFMSSAGALPTAAATTKLPLELVVAPAVMLGSAAAPEAASTSGELDERTVSMSCVGAPAATKAPGTGKTAATTPLTTNSSAAPAPPVAVSRARLCAPVTKAG